MQIHQNKWVHWKKGNQDNDGLKQMCGEKVQKRRAKESEKDKKACCVQGCPLDGAADGQESKRRESQPAGSSFSRTFKDQSPAHNKKGKKRRDPVKRKSLRALPLIKLELPTHWSERKVPGCGSLSKSLWITSAVGILFLHTDGAQFRLMCFLWNI